MVEKKTKESYPWSKYVGREVVYKLETTIAIMGKMLPPNVEYGYIEFSPYISRNADDETARLNENPETPLTKSLQIFDRNVLYGIEAKKDGFLEERVLVINKAARKRGMGFHIDAE
jgi:hypothetical protein